MKKWNEDFGFTLNVAAKLYREELNNELSKGRVTLPQWLVIKYLYDEQAVEMAKGHSPAVIAQHVKKDRPTISAIIERLVKQGYVSRASNPKDRRSQLIFLSKKSKEFIERMIFIENKINNKIVKGFKQSEIDDLKGYILRIILNLKNKEAFLNLEDELDNENNANYL